MKKSYLYTALFGMIGCLTMGGFEVHAAVPAAPTGLKLTVVNSSRIDLQWTDRSSNETGFKIEQKSTSGNFVQIGKVGAKVQRYISNGLFSYTVYSYRVCAYNGSGNSPYTNVAEIETSIVDPSLNGAPVSSLLMNPFNKWSAHHRPIGAGAVAGVPGGTTNPRAKTPVYDSPGAINSRGRIAIVDIFRVGPEDKVMLKVKTSDPYQIIKKTGGGIGDNLPTASPGLRFPYSNRLPRSGDAIVALYPRNGLGRDIFDVFAQFRYPAFTAKSRASYPLAGSDTYEDKRYDRSPGATAVRIPSGVLRGDEINKTEPSPIFHALNATATRHSGTGAPAKYHVLSRKMVWPAYSTDSSADGSTKGVPNNQGDIAYGTVIYIPSQYRSMRDKLGLNKRQLVIFDTLCYYGCRLIDGQGAYTKNGAIMQLRTDGELNDLATKDVNTVLQKSLKYLYPLRNPRPHHKETEVWTKDGLPYVGGGGPISATKSVNDAWDVK